MEEDKQNKDTDVEMEMDDDGPQLLRDISKHSTVMKDHMMSIDSEVRHYSCQLQKQAQDLCL